MLNSKAKLLIDVDSLVLPQRVDDTLAQVLVKEKEYIDSQISANLEANIKILGAVATAVVAGLGWVFSKDTSIQPHQVVAILLALVTLSSFGSLIGTIFNGFAFGYIAYKALYLGRLFRHLCNIGFNPLLTSGYFSATPGQKPIIVGTMGSGISQILLNWGLFLWAINLIDFQVPHSGQFGVPAEVAYFVGTFLVIATIGTFLTMWAMFRTRKLIMDEIKDQERKAATKTA